MLRRLGPVSPEPVVDIGREEAADAAAEELSKHPYLAEEPGLVARVFGWLSERLTDLVLTVSQAVPGGWWPLLAIPVLLAVAIVVIRWRVGPLARRRARPDPIFVADRDRTAAEHRALAERAVASADLDTAVRELFRALVRELTERSILDERPGRTAGEVATEVAALTPGQADVFSAAAGAFDAVCYGRHPATAEAVEAVRAADDAARQLRLVEVGA